MQEAFPGDIFPFWKRQEIPGKRDLECFALLDALRALVEGQAHRIARSRSLLKDPLRHFRRLYRKELLAHVSEDQVLSPWRLIENPDALRAAGAGYVDEESGVSFDEDMLKTVVGVRIKREVDFFLLRCMLATARGEDDKDGPAHVRSFLLVRRMERMGLISPEDPDQCLKAAASVEDLQERIREIEAKVQMLRSSSSWEGMENYVNERLPAEVLNALSRPPCRHCKGLSDGEHGAVAAALCAIMHGASPFSYSRRGDALSNYLTPNQSRQLRRACARCGEVR
jgi:hypothetical protein